ncbi:hypothetical protein ACFV1L_13210 [Kitasatospora sp. NPDC059646]|uniref:hypothetical protein n=1 Tax=Kitasatospora sp. NPDC059646 TaxID=3346893 RepID=UPI00368FFC6B
MSERLADPAEPPTRTITLSGLLGDSDRAGHRRLYFNKQLDYYAEFASSDVLSVRTVGTGQPPFVGLEATEVTLRRNATVRFTQVETATPEDEFDLDLRLGARPPRAQPVQPLAPQTWEAECPGPTFGGCPTDFGCATEGDCPTGFTVCKPRTCQGATCDTCRGNTCQTCGQGTCHTCGEATCRTCDQATCATCQGATCHTCDTCAHQTCVTCETCNPHLPTCRPVTICMM